MKYGQIDNPENFFHQLGSLHDARIEYFEWVPAERKVLIIIDDLNSNFLNLPEYEGLLPATLVFSNVRKMIIGVDPTEEHLNIYEMESKRTNILINVMIKCWPGGKIEFTCGSIEVREKKMK